MRNTFLQLEKLVDQVNENAVHALYHAENRQGLPSRDRLLSLKRKLGVSSLHIANNKGIIIQTTSISEHKSNKSLYEFCTDYRSLIHGKTNNYKTPIIPDSYFSTPYKYMMIPNHNRTLILESGTELSYIAKIFHQTISSDRNIKSIGLYTPTGMELGFISENGYFSNRTGKSLRPIINSKHYEISNSNAIFDVIIPLSNQSCCECTYKNVSDNNGKYYYILQIKVALNELDKSLSQIRNYLVVIFIFTLAFSWLISKIFANKLSSRLRNISLTAKNIIESGNLDLRVLTKYQSDEVDTLSITFNRMIEALKQSQMSIIETEGIRTKGKIAAQLAHDIRSPLAVMELTVSSISKNLDSTQLNLLYEAIHSIRDIANNLLIRYRKLDVEDSNSNTSITLDDGNIERPILLNSIIDLIISHKRKEWERNPCEISFSTEPNMTSAWIHTSPNEIKRNLSNLLNNAYEALTTHGHIKLHLANIDDRIVLSITDNGSGIPNERLHDVLNGVSLKHEGKGMGLSGAVKFMHSLGGKLSLQSSPTYGAEVSLTFPMTKRPEWFPDSMIIPSKYSIVIIDDDHSIHNLWRYRFQGNNIRSYHFTSSNDFFDWYKKTEDKALLFLVDYELRDDDYNGVEILRQLNVGKKSYLVTSHGDSLSVQQTCEQLGVWLIPKSRIGSIHIVN